MLTLQFKNEHIYFIIDSSWETLDYRFKNQVHDLVAANSENDFVQTLNIPVKILLSLFMVATAQPEGVAAFINSDMLTSLVGQLMPLSNFQQVQASIDAKNTWNETVYQPWYEETYLPWREDHPEVEGVTYEDEPVVPSPEPLITPYNEASQVLMSIEAIDMQNKTVKNNRIVSGKAKILSE